jgi:hypothetical protein
MTVAFVCLLPLTCLAPDIRLTELLYRIPLAWEEQRWLIGRLRQST